MPPVLKDPKTTKNHLCNHSRHSLSLSLMSIYVTEPPHEYLRVFDPVSGGTIVCANKTHISPAWIRQFVGKQTHTIDVTRRFTHDQFVGAKKVQEFAAMLVDYSCEMHKALMKTKRVVVYCKNGRSRSPCVVLAFYLLRGMSRDHAVEYLRLAFQTQRPTIYERSANFRKSYTVAFNFTVLPILVSNTMNSSLPIHSQFRQVPQ